MDIVDFFRNFTVEVVGVGDTCSFAQMDVRQHGHPAVGPVGAVFIPGFSRERGMGIFGNLGSVTDKN